MFNHLFGYGVLDAGSLVDAALTWTNVPERKSCIVGELVDEWNTETGEDAIELTMDTDVCKGTDNEVNYIEHVQAFISVQSTRRGDLTMNMTSPMNTNSLLLQRRPRDDDSSVGLNEWPFVSVQYWGERPAGTWTIRIQLKGLKQEMAQVTKWKLAIHGTTDAWKYLPGASL